MTLSADPRNFMRYNLALALLSVFSGLVSAMSHDKRQLSSCKDIYNRAVASCKSKGGCSIQDLENIFDDCGQDWDCYVKVCAGCP